MWKPIAQRSHTGGLLVTISRFGDAERYIHDFVNGLGPYVTSVYRTVADAQSAADARVCSVGHECGDGCDGWRDA